MFNFGKKQDPQKALDSANKSLNSGISGGLTRAFMGKGFVDQANAALGQGQAALDAVQQQAWLAQNGLDATAEVISVQDTGATVNMNPIVLLQLQVTPMTGPGFGVTAQTLVSRIAVPRTGDQVRIKYNPANPQQLMVL